MSYPFSQREKMYTLIHEDSYGRILDLKLQMVNFHFIIPQKNLLLNKVILI